MYPSRSSLIPIFIAFLFVFGCGSEPAGVPSNNLHTDMSEPDMSSDMSEPDQPTTGDMAPHEDMDVEDMMMQQDMTADADASDAETDAGADMDEDAGTDMDPDMGESDMAPTGCQNNQDCATDPDGPYCELNLNMCTECLLNDHCPMGFYCELGFSGLGDCLPNPCTMNSDCDDSNECTINTCDTSANLCESVPVANDIACDGGNGTCQSGHCIPNNASPDVFRLESLQLIDPHLHYDTFICLNITGNLNGILDDNLSDFSLNIHPVFVPLLRANMARLPFEAWSGSCTDEDNCTAVLQNPNATMYEYTEMGTCLEPDASQVHFGSPRTVANQCFVTDAFDLVFDLDVVELFLSDAEIAGRMTDDDNVTEGLIRGFLSETTAQSIIIPENIAVVGGQTLYSLLPPNSCNSTDARNMHNGESGWWVHMHFTARRVANPTGF